MSVKKSLTTKVRGGKPIKKKIDLAEESPNEIQDPNFCLVSYHEKFHFDEIISRILGRFISVSISAEDVINHFLLYKIQKRV